MQEDEGLFKKRILPYLKAWREDCVCGEDGFWKIFEEAKQEFPTINSIESKMDGTITYEALDRAIIKRLTWFIKWFGSE